MDEQGITHGLLDGVTFRVGGDLGDAGKGPITAGEGGFEESIRQLAGLRGGPLPAAVNPFS
jgi:hypothetical protein